jgi:hypothetical protein
MIGHRTLCKSYERNERTIWGSLKNKINYAVILPAVCMWGNIKWYLGSEEEEDDLNFEGCLSPPPM